MASKLEPTEDDSFIILGTSPGTSLDLKCNGVDGRSLDQGVLDPDSLERGMLDDAIKDLSDEASSAFKAHFKLDDGPSPASLMVASTIITDDKSTEELQKQFGELLDENIILKETLEKNNESLKEQFMLISSCQEDMMKTRMIHKEKFDETRELIEKLRQENKKLKLDISRLATSEGKVTNTETGEPVSGPMSALEFVTSPDDDVINKLTAQLELVEKQRRQVIVDNEKLTWQKESLEHIVDATSKERDDLKEKVRKLELQLSNLENEYTEKINLLNFTIQDLNMKMESASHSMSSKSSGELAKRDEIIRQLDTKITTLQSDLKNAQLKVLEAENVRLEFTKYKSGVNDTVKMYKDQIQELHSRLKDAQTTVFQPIRFSVSTEADGGENPEHAKFMNDIKLYDKTLKHLADLLNLITHGSVDGLVECLGVVASLHDFKLDKSNVEQVKSSLSALRQQLDKQHHTALTNIGQVRNTLSIFEGIFKDYKEILKKASTKAEASKPTPPAPNVEQLTAALVARGHELQALQSELSALKGRNDDTDILKAQLDLYKSDFEAERQAREKMACEKETLQTDLRTTQRRNQELLLQLEEVRLLNPNIFKSATSKRLDPNAGPGERPQSQGSEGSNRPTPGSRRQSAPGTATGNMVYTCPKCRRFSSDEYSVMEDHFDFCLDDLI